MAKTEHMSLKTTTDAFIAEVLADDPLYPNGTVFIDVEAPDYVQAIGPKMEPQRSQRKQSHAEAPSASSASSRSSAFHP